MSYLSELYRRTCARTARPKWLAAFGACCSTALTALPACSDDGKASATMDEVTVEDAAAITQEDASVDMEREADVEGSSPMEAAVPDASVDKVDSGQLLWERCGVPRCVAELIPCYVDLEWTAMGCVAEQRATAASFELDYCLANGGREAIRQTVNADGTGGGVATIWNPDGSVCASGALEFAYLPNGQIDEWATYEAADHQRMKVHLKYEGNDLVYQAFICPDSSEEHELSLSSDCELRRAGECVPGDCKTPIEE